MSPRAVAAAPTSSSPRPARATAAVARARTCYDHLAGRLGVEITDAMIRAGLLRQGNGLALTDAGHAWLATNLAIEATTPRRNQRPVVRACLDWTERRPHLAGAAGAQLCRHLIEQEWIVRIDASRAVRLTPAGATALHRMFGIDALE